MGKKTAIFVLLVLALLIAIAAYDPLRNAISGALRSVGGSAYIGLESWWGGVVAQPAYQTWHVFIWFGAGIVFTLCMLQLFKRGKLLIKPKPQPQGQMGPPTPIILQEQPVPTKPATQPEQQQQNPS